MSPTIAKCRTRPVIGKTAIVTFTFRPPWRLTCLYAGSISSRHSTMASCGPNIIPAFVYENKMLNNSIWHKPVCISLLVCFCQPGVGWLTLIYTQKHPPWALATVWSWTLDFLCKWCRSCWIISFKFRRQFSLMMSFIQSVITFNTDNVQATKRHLFNSVLSHMSCYNSLGCWTVYS